MNKRVKAFTIMEITVAMLISALVIAITYTCYTIVYQSYTSYQSRQSKLAEINQFTQTLTRDLERSEIVLLRADTIIIKNESITYQIRPEYTLRTKGITDTFKVKTADLACFFEGRALNAESAGLADEISFTIIVGDAKIPYHYLKSYSSQNLINSNPNALN